MVYENMCVGCLQGACFICIFFKNMMQNPCQKRATMPPHVVSSSPTRKTTFNLDFFHYAESQSFSFPCIVKGFVLCKNHANNSLHNPPCKNHAKTCLHNTKTELYARTMPNFVYIIRSRSGRDKIMCVARTMPKLVYITFKPRA